MSRCILLLNRSSGANQRGLDADEISRNVERIFREEGHEIRSILAEPKDLGKLLTDSIAAAPDLIVIGGGDGTVSTAAGLMGGTGIAMGILPMGTFNLAARDLGVPLEMEAAARFLATAAAHPIDVLDVAGRACLCTTIFGFYPEFSNLFENRDANAGRWWKKAFTILTSLRSTFMLARPLRFSWSGDAGEGSARSKFSAFVPGRYKESPGLIPTRTDFRSGNLTAYIGTQQSASAAMLGIVDYTLGRLEKNPGLQVFQTSKLTLRASKRKKCMVMLDGEILRLRFPVEMKILPGHLLALTAPERLAESPSPSAA